MHSRQIHLIQILLSIWLKRNQFYGFLRSKLVSMLLFQSKQQKTPLDWVIKVLIHSVSIEMLYFIAVFYIFLVAMWLKFVVMPLWLYSQCLSLPTVLTWNFRCFTWKIRSFIDRICHWCRIYYYCRDSLSLQVFIDMSCKQINMKEQNIQFKW